MLPQAKKKRHSLWRNQSQIGGLGDQDRSEQVRQSEEYGAAERAVLREFGTKTSIDAKENKATSPQNKNHLPSISSATSLKKNSL